MWRRRAAAAVLAAMTAGTAWTATLPSAQGQIQAHEHHERILSLQQDDFVQGRWRQSGAVALELLGPDGKRIRRLSQDDDDGSPFGFVARSAGEYRLRVAGQGSYEWQLTSISAPQAPEQAEPIQGEVIRQWALRLRAGESSDRFWDYVERVGSPLVERYSATHDRVTFVWRGARDNARIHGGPASYNDRMRRLGDSDIWYISYDVPRDARFSYRVAADVPHVRPAERRAALRATLQRDPYNARLIPEDSADLFEGGSVLRLPQAPAPQVQASAADQPQGQWRSGRLSSKALGNERDIHIYQPAGSQAADLRHLLILFDGREYREIANAPVLVDALIDQGRIPPAWVVLVDNPGSAARSRELPPNDAYIEFLRMELMPWLAAHGVAAAAGDTVIAGSSYGGLAALHAGWRLPQYFGNVLSLSGSYWWGPSGERGQWLTRRIADAPAAPVKVYMSAGIFENSGSGLDVSLVQANRHLYDVLRARGYDVRYDESSTGHDYVAWRDALALGLEHLLGRPAGAEAGRGE